MPRVPDASPIAADAAARYGVAADDLVPLGAFESEVFAMDGPRGPAVLKVIAPEHRGPDQVRAEVDWVRALADAGLPVAEPLPSSSGAWVESLRDPERTLVAFRRAPGHVTRPGEWTDARIRAWGALLGRLQAHARAWTPPGPRRRALAAQSYLARASEVRDTDPDFARAAGRLWRRAAWLLRPGTGAGLIHADLHHGNLLLADEGWTAIDFDDCGYGAFAFDLAMPLYYAVRAQRDRAPEDVAADFLPPFLDGFLSHAPAPAGGAEAVAACLELRQAELVMALWLKLPADAWTDATRAAHRELREGTIAGRAPLSPTVLRRWL